MSTDILTQALGIAGTVTGVLALLVSYRTYSSARPKLKITPSFCKHHYQTDNQTGKISKITINSKFAISNCGDRATTLNTLKVQYAVGDKSYEIEKEIRREINDWEREETYYSKISVSPHDTIDEYFSVDSEFEGMQEQKQTIKCTFKIYHTHGVCSLEVISNLS